MILSFSLACLGLGVLMWSCDTFVDWARETAVHLKVSPMVIGLTIVAFGTSAPELVVSVHSAAIGSGALAVGNIAGSNIANTLLILGAAAVIRPVVVGRNNFIRDTFVWAAATVALVGFAYGGEFNWPIGLLFIAGLALYLSVLFRSEKTVEAVVPREDVVEHKPRSFWRSYGLPILLLAGIGFGAHLAVENSVDLARGLGVSEAIIGVTLLAVGTSLPELATALVCIRKAESEMLVGNVIGSNIFNILAVMGVASLVAPIAVPPHMLLVDFPVLLAVTVASLFFLRTNWLLSRREGYACLAGYTAYLGSIAAKLI
ncbi:calcium/sodium antiporter [Bauldia sp.]|uniref:calcium/sodium antiporter n=1 Tax=Bauldia sp. TaxID=2575872 RepID=UPI003BA8EF88